MSTDALVMGDGTYFHISDLVRKPSYEGLQNAFRMLNTAIGMYKPAFGTLATVGLHSLPDDVMLKVVRSVPSFVQTVMFPQARRFMLLPALQSDIAGVPLQSGCGFHPSVAHKVNHIRELQADGSAVAQHLFGGGNASHGNVEYYPGARAHNGVRVPSSTAEANSLSKEEVETLVGSYDAAVARPGPGQMEYFYDGSLKSTIGVCMGELDIAKAVAKQNEAELAGMPFKDKVQTGMTFETMHSEGFTCLVLPPDAGSYFHITSARTGHEMFGVDELTDYDSNCDCLCDLIGAGWHKVLAKARVMDHDYRDLLCGGLRADETGPSEGVPFNTQPYLCMVQQLIREELILASGENKARYLTVMLPDLQLAMYTREHGHEVGWALPFGSVKCPPPMPVVDMHSGIPGATYDATMWYPTMEYKQLSTMLATAGQCASQTALCSILQQHRVDANIHLVRQFVDAFEYTMEMDDFPDSEVGKALHSGYTGHYIHMPEYHFLYDASESDREKCYSRGLPAMCESTRELSSKCSYILCRIWMIVLTITKTYARVSQYYHIEEREHDAWGTLFRVADMFGNRMDSMWRGYKYQSTRALAEGMISLLERIEKYDEVGVMIEYMCQKMNRIQLRRYEAGEEWPTEGVFSKRTEIGLRENCADPCACATHDGPPSAWIAPMHGHKYSGAQRHLEDLLAGRVVSPAGAYADREVRILRVKEIEQEDLHRYEELLTLAKENGKHEMVSKYYGSMKTTPEEAWKECQALKSDLLDRGGQTRLYRFVYPRGDTRQFERADWDEGTRSTYTDSAPGRSIMNFQYELLELSQNFPGLGGGGWFGTPF